MNEVAIYNKTDEEFPYEEIIEKVVNKAFEVEGVKKASCSIIIVDNTFIHKLNKEYRGIDRVTDVISFALEDDKSMIIPDDIRLLGDIYICLDKAREQAKEYGHSLERELCFLAVHGVYHLLGYDHENEEEAKIMFKKQEEVLMEYGITR
ncbi:MAG TPA: rRNA maturation RNase YbeY [Candidatus Onthousia faecipullorum]|uniref:Endoribonuclease YbeY n=1 Tax=Candidatus Onthousia faecipullorum TaxID=2840887 RepID=A0A9D1GBN8_9FIRM|nr:rRNA maturation RNase YbeY [Candidatus Onthousia faecipullorum]